MGYNLSSNAFNQVKSILDELVDLQIGSIWKQSFQDNNKAARLIRQGLEYCVKNEETVGKRFSELKKNIRIRATNDYVLAERKFGALEVKSIVEPVRSKTFNGLTTFNEVLTTFLANRQLTELWFPDFKDKIEVNLLSKVAQEHGYSVAVSDINNAVGIYKTHQTNGETRKQEEHTD